MHFNGIVIKTPDFDLDLDLMLETYSVNAEVPYHYCHDEKKIDLIRFYVNYHKDYELDKLILEFADEKGISYTEFKDAYYYVIECEDEFANWFESKYGLEGLLDLYKEHGKEWSNNLVYNPFTMKFEYWSTYNDDGKFDWYQLEEVFDTPNGVRCYCQLSQLPFNDETKKIDFKYTPSVVVINGMWCKRKRGQSYDSWNEYIYKILKEIDSNSEVYWLNFHY